MEVEKVEAVTDFIFLGSKTTEDIDYNQEIKRSLKLFFSLEEKLWRT